MAYFGRGKNKVQNPYVLKDIYYKYVNNLHESSLYYVDYNTFVSITTSYIKKIVDVVLDKGMSFHLPARIGDFQIVKKKRRPTGERAIDWEQTVKVGKRVFTTNNHTNGYKYLWYWARQDANPRLSYVINEYKYRFMPCRANKRKLAFYLKNRIKDYLEHNKK